MKNSTNKQNRSIELQIQKIEHCIFGNGVVGMNDRIKKIESDVGEIRKDIMKIKEEHNKRYYIVFGIVTALLFVSEILFSFYKWG